MLYCGKKLISYQLQDGIFHCTEELVHSEAVLAALPDDKRTMYIMRIAPLQNELHCACNFKDPQFGRDSCDLKIAGSLEEFLKSMPSYLAEYKVRRIVFDDPELFEKFKAPELQPLMLLLPFVPVPKSTLARLTRFTPSNQPATKTQPVTKTRLTPKGWLVIAIFVAIILAIVIIATVSSSS